VLTCISSTIASLRRRRRRRLRSTPPRIGRHCLTCGRHACGSRRSCSYRVWHTQVRHEKEIRRLFRGLACKLRRLRTLTSCIRWKYRNLRIDRQQQCQRLSLPMQRYLDCREDPYSVRSGRVRFQLSADVQVYFMSSLGIFGWRNSRNGTALVHPNKKR
jgi:hypothetical protein